MGYRDCAATALLCSLAAVSACATKLDFDRVSAGGDAETPAEANVADARVADARVADARVVQASVGDATVKADAASSALDATTGVLPTTPSDAGAPPTTPSDASEGQGEPVVDASQGPDRSLFSCQDISPTPQLCDDFEGPPLTKWPDVWVIPGQPVLAGSVEVDGSPAVSGQHSLLAQVYEDVSVSDCAGCPTVGIAANLPNLAKPTKVSVEFDLQMEAIDRTFGRRMAPFQLMWGTVATGFTFHSLVLESGGASIRAGLMEFNAEPVDESPDPIAHEFVSIPALSRWVHVHYIFEIEDLSPIGNFVTLTVDDIRVYAGPPSFGLRAADVRLEIGVPWVDTLKFTEQDKTKSWRVRFDNVLVRNEPR